MAITQNFLKPTINPTSTSFYKPSSLTSKPPLSLITNTNSLFLIPTAHNLQNPAPTFTRRLFIPSVSGIWDALTGGNNNSREAVIAIRRGMSLFRQGDVVGSLAEFDKAIEWDPRQKAYLWQRGLSLYYLNSFEEGAEQFRLDVAQNPNDTEESIWCFLCEAQLYSVDEARKLFLEVDRDPRPVMREVYNMFKDGGDPEKLVAAFSSARENEKFYASLYAGLYYESQVGSEPQHASSFGNGKDISVSAWLSYIDCHIQNLPATSNIVKYDYGLSVLAYIRKVFIDHCLKMETGIT